VIAPGLRKWLAFGNGVGISIEGPRGAEALHIALLRVRPGRAKVIDSLVVDDYQSRPAAEWGAEYAALLSKHGMQHVAATVLLPRHEVILRQISLPGVSDKDLDAAVTFQLDGLHPYDEADVASSWARLEGSDGVAVAIARKDPVAGYATVFAEAGVKLSGFTASGIAMYSGLRMFGAKPAAEVFAVDATDRGVEVYGESAAKPMLSALFDLGSDGATDRALALAAAELRLENPPVPVSFGELLKGEPARPFVAGLTSACPRLSSPLNLLPMDQREIRSAWQWIPTVALAAAVLLAAITLAFFQSYRNGSYLETLNAEITKAQASAQRASAIDQEIDATRARTLLLDGLRRKAQADMDVLAELTKQLPPPTWLNSLTIDSKQVSLTGETEQAAPLLRRLDQSPLFDHSEFVSPPSRNQRNELFSIRTQRSSEAGR
jgi:Tfp pilus assembly protein PilN